MRTNLLSNPSCLNNANNWWGSPESGRVTGVTGMPRTTGYGAVATGGVAMPRMQVTPGITYTVSVYVKAVGGPAAGGCGLDWYDASGWVGGQGGSSYDLAAGESTRIYVTATAVATSIDALMNVTVNSLGGSRVEITAGLYEEGTVLGSFFDGDSGEGYAWTGTPGNSTSTGPDEEPPDPVEGEAGVIHGWGTPFFFDDFDGTTLGGEWSVYDGPGHDGNGTRDPERVTVSGSVMYMEGLGNGSSAGMAHEFDQQYGRWEMRCRWYSTGVMPNPADPTPYHPVLIIWPASFLPPPDWPQYGEYDFVENNIGDDRPAAFIHYPHPPDPGGAIQQEFAEYPAPLDMAEFHNYAVEWTSEHVKGYVDGVEWYSFSDGAVEGVRSNIQDMPSGHLAIQLDNYHGTNLQPAMLEVDWVKVYDLSGTGEPVSSAKHRGFLGLLMS